MNSGLLRSALLVFLCANLLIFSDPTAAQPPDTRGVPDSVTLTPGPAPTGPTLRAADSSYLSPITEAVKPFTHLLLRWEATQPVSHSLELEVRISTDGAVWTDWGHVPENPDLWQPKDGDKVYWSQVIYADEGARFWQVRSVITPAPDGALPVLHNVQVNTVDARWATDDTPQRSAIAPASLSKPSVISRTGWGSPDGQGSRVKPVYYPVNHMVVHHTADANTLSSREQNWGDRVRAEWSFHTFTRGWGDVGYNYLIAPTGTIYEGRAGGDDAIAFHDTANYGSMGVVLIGTYSSVTPTAASQASLVELLAWKADQKDIDPLGRSFYYGCSISKYCKPFTSGAVVENIAGHRQVTPGHTTCPGDQIINLLPGIRNRVYERLAGGGPTNPGNPDPQPDNGDLLIDELEGIYSSTDATWYESSCGYGGHTFYTYTTDKASESTNSATWRPTIPRLGRYRIYVHVPQNCGLGTSPYASARATYRIKGAEGDFTRTVDQNTTDEWIDLGSYAFKAGSEGTVTLNDLTGEPYSARKVLFFDSIKWVHEEETAASVELTKVRYEPSTIAAGQLLTVRFTVKNTGATTISGQAPQSGTRPDGTFDPTNGYVYDENECYLGDGSGTYPAFPKETDRFRVTLGAQELSPACVGGTGGYPWRWGLDGPLAPGQEREIVGHVRFRTAGRYTLTAGVVQEYVKYHVQSANNASITVTPERGAPNLAAFDEQLRPLAQVYQLGSIPDNFLARTSNPLSIPQGEWLGSFPWDGTTINWGDNGPFDLSDGFLVEQTRLFRAPTSGLYTFRTTSDDGSWLWVDGTPVVANFGLHPAQEITGTIRLDAGSHLLAFKYFERTGEAAAGYDLLAPGGSAFGPPIDDLGGGAMRLGTTFINPPELRLGADDGGGSGVARISYSWDGTQWNDAPGGLVRLGKIVNGSYTLRYRATDTAGNTSATHNLDLSVNTNLRVYRTFMPLIRR